MTMTTRTNAIPRVRSWKSFTTLGFVATLVAGAAGCAYDAAPSDEPVVTAPPAVPANPTGTGERVSAKIDGATGGKIALANGTELEIPAGALPSGIDTIVITSAPDAAPAEYKAASPMFVFEPDGTVFLKPVKISLRVTVGPGVSASDLTILWSRSQGEGFDMVPTQLVPVAGSRTELLAVGEVMHFSRGFGGLKYTTDPHPTPDPYADK